MRSTTLQLVCTSWDRKIPEGTSTEGALVLNDMIGRWCEDQRYYHDIEHLYDVLYCLDTELSYGDPTCAEALYLAAWYHDAIYDPKAPKGENELASAKLAFNEISSRLGLSQGLAGQVSDIIMMTIDHNATTHDEKIFSDADMGILREGPSVYNRYIANLRTEFNFATDEQWIAGRSDFLSQTLKKDQIFFNEDHWYFEDQARRNMQQELANLNAGVIGPIPVFKDKTKIGYL